MAGKPQPRLPAPGGTVIPLESRRNERPPEEVIDLLLQRSSLPNESNLSILNNDALLLMANRMLSELSRKQEVTIALQSAIVNFRNELHFITSKKLPELHASMRELGNAIDGVYAHFRKTKPPSPEDESDEGMPRYRPWVRLPKGLKISDEALEDLRSRGFVGAKLAALAEFFGKREPVKASFSLAQRQEARRQLRILLENALTIYEPMPGKLHMLEVRAHIIELFLARLKPAVLGDTQFIAMPEANARARQITDRYWVIGQD